MRRYLVVAHQTLGSPELLEAMRDRLAEGSCTFHLLVPEYHGGPGLTWTEGTVRAEGDGLHIAELVVILDTMDSVPLRQLDLAP